MHLVSWLQGYALMYGPINWSVTFRVMRRKCGPPEQETGLLRKLLTLCVQFYRYYYGDKT